MNIKELISYRLRFLAIYSQLSLGNKHLSEGFQDFVVRWDNLFLNIPTTSSEKTVFLSFFSDISFFFGQNKSILDGPSSTFFSQIYHLIRLLKFLTLSKSGEPVESILSRDVVFVSGMSRFKDLSIFSSPLSISIKRKGLPRPEMSERMRSLWDTDDKGKHD
jgi:hypothetical protein